MNKRVTIEMPDEMHKLLAQHVAEAGAETNSYLLALIEQHLEDLHDIAAADAAMEKIRKGDDKVISAEEFWRGLDD